MNTERKLSQYTYLFPAICILIISLVYIQKFDCMWWTIDTGRHILKEGFIQDIWFSVQPGMKTVIQNYATCVLWALLYDHLGLLGLFLYKSIMYVILLLTCMYLFQSFGQKRNIAFFILSPLLFVFISSANNPGMEITLPLIVLQLLCMEKYKQTNQIKYLIGVPLITLLEANFHASTCFLHYLFLLPFCIPGFHTPTFKFCKKPYKTIPILICMIVTFFVTFLNPYTAGSAFYAFKSMDNIMGLVFEMNPPPLTFQCNFLFIGILIFIIWKLYKKQPLEMEYICLFLGTSIMYFKAVKCFSYMTIAAICVLGKHIDFSKINAFLLKCQLKKRELITLFLITTVAVCCYCYHFTIAELTASFDGLESHIEKDAAVMSDASIAGYFVANGHKVLLDNRLEWYLTSLNQSIDLAYIYLDYIQGDKQTYKRVKNQYHFDYYVVCNESSQLSDLIKHDKDMEYVCSQKYFSYTYALYKNSAVK